MQPSLYARELDLVLKTSQDALDAMASAPGGCIFELTDLHDDFFNLKNGLAGEIFQKFTNYGFYAAFVLPNPEHFGERVVELCRDHERHSHIRMFTDPLTAQTWLNQVLHLDQQQQQ